MPSKTHFTNPQTCPCGNLTRLDPTYPKKGYLKYCSDACSKKYRSEDRDYNKIMSNKDWLYEQRIILKKSKEKIAEELNCSTTVVNKWLKYHEIEIQKNPNYTNVKIPVPPKEELVDLYINKNMTLLDIGKHYNISNVTVKKWFVEYDIPLLSHSKTIKQKVVPKIIEYNKEKYGTEHFFGSEEGKEKVKNTFIEKYGVPWHPIGNESKAELEVLEYFNSLITGFEKTRIHGIELDGFNKQLNIAFEYHGLFYHSEKYKGKDLQQKKYKICLENNIRLFSIFEDEWLERKDQVKGFIKSALKQNENKIFARNLIVKEVSGRDYKTLMFIENNHIQGKPNERDCLKHFILIDDNDEIYSVMSFSKHPRNNVEVVLSRYCVKNNYDIIGGAQRLFSHAIENFNCNIKTWSDNRWTEGDLYLRLGFEKVQDLNKDYYYVKGGTRIHKQKMKKSIIGATEEQTEYEKAQELGFDRIWDCGKKTWMYKN